MPRQSYNLTPDTIAQIEVRAEGDGRKTDTLGVSRVVERDLQRYYTALRYARTELRKLLTPDEVALIVDNLNGVILWDSPEIGVRCIPLNVADGIEMESLDRKWGVDGKALVEKLQSLDLLRLEALADAVERFWLDCAGKDPRAALGLVGDA